MIPLGKQIQTSLRLISASLSNVLYFIYDVSVVSRCTLYLNKILFTLRIYREYITEHTQQFYKHIFIKRFNERLRESRVITSC